VIYLTADRDVVAWARIEAIGGELSVIDPAPGGATAGQGTGPPPAVRQTTVGR
jgi:hypothetical protein